MAPKKVAIAPPKEDAPVQKPSASENSPNVPEKRVAPAKKSATPTKRALPIKPPVQSEVSKTSENPAPPPKLPKKPPQPSEPENSPIEAPVSEPIKSNDEAELDEIFSQIINTVNEMEEPTKWRSSITANAV